MDLNKGILLIFLLALSRHGALGYSYNERAGRRLLGFADLVCPNAESVLNLETLLCEPRTFC